MKFYIASKLENAEMVKRVANVLKAAGWEHTYDWTEHGSVKNEGDARLAQVAEAELSGVMNADVVIVILPGGRGTHAELGMALAGRRRDKKIIICAETDDAFQLDDRTCAFYWNYGILRVVGPIDFWLAEILCSEITN
jgi:nucleoside 2-deoxyribosyltransferase